MFTFGRISARSLPIIIIELIRLCIVHFGFHDHRFYDPPFYDFWSWSEIARYSFIVYIVAIICWLLSPYIKGIANGRET